MLLWGILQHGGKTPLLLAIPLFVSVWIMRRMPLVFCLLVFLSLSGVCNFMLPYVPTVTSKSFSRIPAFQGPIRFNFFSALRITFALTA